MGEAIELMYCGKFQEQSYKRLDSEQGVQETALSSQMSHALDIKSEWSTVNVSYEVCGVRMGGNKL